MTASAPTLSFRSRWCQWLALLSMALILTGCESVRYYWQAARGHFELMQAVRPVDEVLEDPATPARLRPHLEILKLARQFAAHTLALEAGDTYTGFVDLKRPAVVWNLFVSPVNRLELKTWCFPVAGCVGYRGYFSHEAAEAAARAYAGDDVWIGGAGAYSTLGWFDDPLLSTMLGPTPLDTAALVFHELAHRTLYIPGDTELNESWATFVEQVGAGQFAHTQGLQSDWARYQQRQAARQAFTDLVAQLLNQLERAYQGATTSDARARREPLFARFRSALIQCAEQHPSLTPWAQHWQRPLNNARLLTVRSYHRWVPALHVQFEALGGQWPAFRAWMQALADQPRDARTLTLESLAQRAARVANQSSRLTNTLEFRCQL
ncbi:MAG: aminopeptidase [Gammaproteobacteria bacterium]|nr:MAG: aminopeptidase [Gammaproteobacteria bacterium]